jgi:hypothetical protein
MRWYRRSASALDEFDKFACLVFGYEALTSLLPFSRSDEDLRKPPEAKHSKGAKGQKASSSDRLRDFAVRHAGIKEEHWKQVGRARHELLHGRLAETAAARAQLAKAIPFLRFVLVTALKHCLGVPADIPPVPSLPPAILTDLHITFASVIRFKSESEPDEQ